MLRIAGRRLRKQEMTNRAGYTVYAKKYAGQFCGDRTHVFGISSAGGMALLDDKDINEIESLGPQIDRVLNAALLEMLNGEGESNHRAFLEIFRSSYLELASKITLSNPKVFERLDGKWEKRRK